ncbi:aminoglycoside phosphotransferase [Streptomyces sp. NPDC013181]|uniref:aminoglycoside phosphotransferase n=1 Tax=Streptomyces sp. NPDC013181 TaxID=3364864 RepID=UPI0036BAA159
MATTRIGLDQLPPAARTAVEEHTGPLLTVEEATEGFNSEIAARVTSATGTWHIKGLRTDHPRAWTQRREAAVAPFLTGLAPALRWHVEAAGWDLLGFEALTGHHADYAPGSPDLPEAASLLRRLGEAACPDSELRQAEQRLERYAAHPDDLRFFTGSHLLHTDLNNTNVLVDDDAPAGERARLVDWAWATRGAAWLDAGYWIIWLITSGHTPASAERWAAEIPSWRIAPAEGITAFATANANLWSEISTADPAPWTRRLAAAATTWHAHRRAG